MYLNIKIKKNENVLEFLEKNYEAFTPTQRKITEYLISFSEEAAFFTADEIASKIGTTSSSIVRFAKEIGCIGYPDLQKRMQSLIIKKINSLGRYELAKKFKTQQGDSLINLSLIADINNLNELINKKDDKNINEFIKIILESEKKYIIANRGMFCISHHFYFQIKNVVKNIFFLSDYDGGIFDNLNDINSKDALIVISFPRFSSLTINFSKYAKKKGAKVISVTNNLTSPLVKLSDVCLFCPHKGVSFFNSKVAAMALLNAITSEIFSKNYDFAINNMEKEERILLDMKVLYMKRNKQD